MNSLHDVFHPYIFLSNYCRQYLEPLRSKQSGDVTWPKTAFHVLNQIYSTQQHLALKFPCHREDGGTLGMVPLINLNNQPKGTIFRKKKASLAEGDEAAPWRGKKGSGWLTCLGHNLIYTSENSGPEIKHKKWRNDMKVWRKTYIYIYKQGSYGRWYFVLKLKIFMLRLHVCYQSTKHWPKIMKQDFLKALFILSYQEYHPTHVH